MSKHCKEVRNKEPPESEWKAVKVMHANKNERIILSPDSDDRTKIVIEKLVNR